jgi:hypothetical protein
MSQYIDEDCSKILISRHSQKMLECIANWVLCGKQIYVRLDGLRCCEAASDASQVCQCHAVGKTAAATGGANEPVRANSYGAGGQTTEQSGACSLCQSEHI